jgi:hypothetical protein
VVHDRVGVADLYFVNGGANGIKYKPDRVTLIKCFGSEMDKARLAPH